MSKMKISDFINQIGDGIHGTPNYTKHGEYYFINGNNLRDGKIVISSDTLKISEEEYKKIERPLNENTILLSINGTLGKLAIYEGENIALGKSACYINVKETVNKYFVKYVLSTKEFQRYIHLVAHGSTIKNLAPSQVADYEFEVSDRLEQEKMALLLKSLDDKIENNNKINYELEKMAKTIYDYWFLQFEFPNEEGKPYKSSGGKMVWNEELKREIPAGWEIDTIGNHVDIIRGISYSSEELEGGGIPLINLNSFNTDSTYKSEGIKTYSGTYSKDKVIRPYDLLMCVTQQTSIDLIRNTDVIGKTFLIPDIFEGKDIVASMDVTKIEVDNVYGKYYLNRLINTNFFHRYISGFANGTKIKHLDVGGLLNYKCEIPEKTILKNFNVLMENIEEKKSKIIAENQELVSLRDFLLPLLMNGQIGFKE